MKKFLYELFSSDGVPSTRVVGAAILILAAVGLEICFVSPANVMEMVNSNFITAGSFFGIYRLGKIGEKAASTPAVDNSKTNITAETAPVNADTVNMNSPAV